MKKLWTLTLMTVVSMGITSTVNADTLLTNSGSFVEPVEEFNFAFRLLDNSSGNLVMVDSISHSLGGSLNTSIDFTAAEGFSDGVDITGISGMNAQSGWVGADTAGTGMATATGNWLRAIEDFNPNSLVAPAIDETMSGSIRVAVDYVGDNTNLGNFGWGDATFNPGEATPGPINRAYGVTSAAGVDTFTFDGLSIDTTNDMYSHGMFVDLTLDVTRTGLDTYDYVSTLSFTMPTAIPEPTTGLVLVAMGMGLVARRKR